MASGGRTKKSYAEEFGRRFGADSDGGASALTAPLLLTAISVAIFLQVAVGLLFWRQQRSQSLTAPAGPAVAAMTATGIGVGWRDLRVTSAGFEDEARTQRSLSLAPVDGQPLADFLPGQYLTFALDLPASPSVPKRTIVRCYSLSDQPNGKAYRITVKRMPAPSDRPELPAGAASSFLHDGVREGDVLKVKAPAGQFVLDATSDVPAVFIAGGIGVTPMISMISWSLAHRPQRRLHLFYGVRNGADHAFKAVLEGIARSHPSVSLHVLYGAPRPGDVGGRDFQHVGFVDVALLKRVLPHGRHLFYVCGPPGMMAALVPALATWGVPKDDIRFESFGPASSGIVQPIKRPAEALIPAPFDVQFRRSRRTVAWLGDDASLLDFAERHGISVESGCRSGSCGSCQTALLAGEVNYDGKPDFEVSAGSCLLCVGIPVSALVLDA